jgi:Ca-activated chloride channel family protein
VLLIVALARPRKQTGLTEISTEGVAMEVVVDHSGSMATEMDYFGQKLSRLEVVKKVLAEFVEGSKQLGGRQGDLIGLVQFARYPDTTCPLVLGHSVLLKFLEGTQIVQLRSEDGTAIGDAIALAAARLKNAEDELEKRKKALGFGESGTDNPALIDNYKIKSKIIILLTDGINNTGELMPPDAAKIAGDWGIRIYTIGIGSGESYMTVQTPLGTYKMPVGEELDESLLKQIAEQTGGFYGRADDAKALQQVVEKIDKLEKSEVKTVQYAQYTEKFGPWTLGAILVLTLEILAGCTIFRKIP